MKLQSATKRETLRIGAGTLACAAVMNLVYVLLGRWNVQVLAGTALGIVGAVGNFFLLALTVQKAASTADEKRATQWMQLSYSLRMLGMGALMVLGFVLPWTDGVACALCMFFPRLTIFILQLTGHYKPETQAVKQEESDKP
jgi:hypothetical protein